MKFLIYLLVIFYSALLVFASFQFTNNSQNFYHSLFVSGKPVSNDFKLEDFNVKSSADEHKTTSETEVDQNSAKPQVKSDLMERTLNIHQPTNVFFSPVNNSSFVNSNIHDNNYHHYNNPFSASQTLPPTFKPFEHHFLSTLPPPPLPSKETPLQSSPPLTSTNFQTQPAQASILHTQHFILQPHQQLNPQIPNQHFH